jgi:hypothetical protein
MGGFKHNAAFLVAIFPLSIAFKAQTGNNIEWLTLTPEPGNNEGKLTYQARLSPFHDAM